MTLLPTLLWTLVLIYVSVALFVLSFGAVQYKTVQHHSSVKAPLFPTFLLQRLDT